MTEKEKKEEERKKERERERKANSTELQKPIVGAEVYKNNKECD